MSFLKASSNLLMGTESTVTRLLSSPVESIIWLCDMIGLQSRSTAGFLEQLLLCASGNPGWFGRGLGLIPALPFRYQQVQ